MFWLGKSIKIDPPKGSDKEKKKKKDKINLSPLEVLILAQLRSREIRNNGDPVGQYGYEMITDLNKLFAGSWEAKSGTIYPILSKLKSNKGISFCSGMSRSNANPAKISTRSLPTGSTEKECNIRHSNSDNLSALS